MTEVTRRRVYYLDHDHAVMEAFKTLKQPQPSYAISQCTYKLTVPIFHYKRAQM
jgi:hypothetical protein